MAKGSNLILPPGYKKQSNPIKSNRTAWSFGNNDLIPAATQNQNRAEVPLLDKDFHCIVNPYGRRVMMSFGRRLYASYDTVRGAVDEMAVAATENWSFSHRTSDKEWKEKASKLIYESNRNCNIAGHPDFYETDLEKIIREWIISGDIGILLVTDEFGNPAWQIIPSHRIGDNGKAYVESGQFKGYRIVDGVILGEYGQRIGYRVLTGDTGDYETFVDVPATSMVLNFIPLFAGQLRGVSLVGYSAWLWKDKEESDKFEMLAQKAAARMVFQIYNENGEAEESTEFIEGETYKNGQLVPTGYWTETLDTDGVQNTYWKSSDPNAKMQAIQFDRPSSNQRDYAKWKTREGLYSLGWSMDYGLDPSKIGGAALRMHLDKLNINLKRIRNVMLRPLTFKFDCFRIGSWIESGKLPFVEDWNNFDYEGPRRLTSDRKYDSSVAIEEVGAGFITRQRACLEREEDSEDVLKSNFDSVDSLFAKANELALKHNVAFNIALAYLEKGQPFGLAVKQPIDSERDMELREEFQDDNQAENGGNDNV